jgi:predicted lipoprotein with Yx(FWY)xxD motif
MRLKHLIVLFVVALLSMFATLSASAQDGDTVGIGNNSDLGSFLVSSNGTTLYTFANDEPGVSNCIGQCLELWPAYTVDSAEVSTSVDIGGELGTIARDDGSLQVTFNNQPLYVYSGDAAPGDVTGQGVGNVWFVVPVSGPVVLAADNEELGSILTGANGFTLYTFDNDTLGVSNCQGGCRESWPALTVSADTALAAGDGVQGILGSIPQEDGSLHVTYYGQPLYFFSGDENAGDTNGQGAGDVWFVGTADTLRIKRNAQLGSILAANNEFTLYTFSNDEANLSNCVGQCVESWPPYLVSSDGDIVAEDGISGAFGTLEREDGSLQVTLDGSPLYYFTGDATRDDATGEGVGNVWFTVKLDDVIVSNNAELGTILAGSNGMTLYVFANDEFNWSNCVGDCATSWPPFTVEEEGAVLAPAALQADFGTTLRADGTIQVTFQTQPLYFFSGDAAVGDTNGNGAGDVWSVVPVSVATCSITPSDATANVRFGPSTEFGISQELAAGAIANANGQALGVDNIVWWRLDTNDWVRSDVVTETGDCDALPQVVPPTAPSSDGTDTSGDDDGGGDDDDDDDGPTATEEP